MLARGCFVKEANFDFVNETNMGLLTDLYELTMCASYFENKRNDAATFDLFIRKLPPNRSYFIFAGLEQVLSYLGNVNFTDKQIKYLRELKLSEQFLEYLRTFKFTGEVWAIPEGNIVFPEEPLIRVTAPIIEAQLIETFILNTVNLQTMLATKASRVVYAARGRSVIEFGLRRTQGTDAGMKAARCSYLVGAEGTSNVLAGMKYNIPVFGTMAHSYVMSFNDELDAFRAFTSTFPDSSTLLIDTYDSLKGTENAVIVAKELEKKGYRLKAVRLDSGDLLTLSKKIRKILDINGLGYVGIFASGDLDEYVIMELLKKGAKIDAFGVGTRMSTSFDRPYVDVVYKLSGVIEGGTFIPAMKLSKGKITLPGKKQVFRQIDPTGKYAQDVIGIENEVVAGERLLIKVMERGQMIRETPSLEEVRISALKNIHKLPDRYRKLAKPYHYPVKLSSELKKIKDHLTRARAKDDHLKL
jgi:nicotinate phosphoribosyltransferase